MQSKALILNNSLKLCSDPPIFTNVVAEKNQTVRNFALSDFKNPGNGFLQPVYLHIKGRNVKNGLFPIYI